MWFYHNFFLYLLWKVMHSYLMHWKWMLVFVLYCTYHSSRDDAILLCFDCMMISLPHFMSLYKFEHNFDGFSFLYGSLMFLPFKIKNLMSSKIIPEAIHSRYLYSPFPISVTQLLFWRQSFEGNHLCLQPSGYCFTATSGLAKNWGLGGTYLPIF